MSDDAGGIVEPDEIPVGWPAKLRAAAEWFDIFDDLAKIIQVKEGTKAAYLLAELTGGTEIQQALRELADEMEAQQLGRTP